MYNIALDIALFLTSVQIIYNFNILFGDKVIKNPSSLMILLNTGIIGGSTIVFNNIFKYLIKNNQKLLESVQSFFYYLFNCILLHNILHNKEWFYTRVFFKNTSEHRFTYIEYIALLISVVHYVIELYDRWYVINTVMIKRKDDTEMMVHHIITSLLIIGAYKMNLCRAALFVLYLHDINDVLLQLSKSLVYIKISEIITNITFIVFIFSWIYTRLYLYKYIVVEMYQVFYGTSILSNILCYLLTILYGLNMYWFKLIMNVLYNNICGGKLEDVRE